MISFTYPVSLWTFLDTIKIIIIIFFKSKNYLLMNFLHVKITSTSNTLKQRILLIKIERCVANQIGCNWARDHQCISVSFRQWKVHYLVCICTPWLVVYANDSLLWLSKIAPNFKLEFYHTRRQHLSQHMWWVLSWYIHTYIIIINALAHPHSIPNPIDLICCQALFIST